MLKIRFPICITACSSSVKEAALPLGALAAFSTFTLIGLSLKIMANKWSKIFCSRKSCCLLIRLIGSALSTPMMTFSLLMAKPCEKLTLRSMIICRVPISLPSALGHKVGVVAFWGITIMSRYFLR